MDKDHKEKVLQRKAARLVEQARKAEERARTAPLIHLVIGPKGGIGKSTLARLLIDKYRLTGGNVRIVQIDRTALLPKLYGELVSVVHLPSAEDMRGDPLAAMIAMEPLSVAIDASLADNAPLVVDVGGGPSASATVEYVGKTRLDAYLRKNGARVVVWLMFVADFAAMGQSATLGKALEVAVPSAEIVPVLNERSGRFKFFTGSSSDDVWREAVVPFLGGRRILQMPSAAAGALVPFEQLGLTFIDIINADDTAIAKRLNVSRAIGASLQGDVAAWLEVMWSGLDALVTADQRGHDA
ncbi:MAG: hypothetical protein JSS22_11365 [Proteobacteria bacterium]|nr:hypothetical protein [Pseudomonadota bacterium]